MTIETFDRAEKLLLSIKEAKEDLNLWQNAITFSNIELYSGCVYKTVNQSISNTAFDQVKELMVKYLINMINRWDAEFKEL